MGRDGLVKHIVLTITARNYILQKCLYRRACMTCYIYCFKNHDTKEHREITALCGMLARCFFSACVLHPRFDSMSEIVFDTFVKNC